MEDPAPPGTAVMAIKGEVARQGALEKAVEALLPQMRLTGTLVKGFQGSDDELRLDLVPPPGTDLKQLACECFTAIENAFRRKAISTGWSLVVVDDQGRVYLPGP
jgi:hypothetical protein